MEEVRINFDTAKLAKEKGFDIPTKARFSVATWHDNNIHLFEKGIGTCNNNNESFSAPTQSLLQKWLREVHNIEVFTKSEWKNKVKIGFYYGILSYNDLYSKPIYKTYEEALEIGLQEALKLI